MPVEPSTCMHLNSTNIQAMRQHWLHMMMLSAKEKLFKPMPLDCEYTGTLSVSTQTWIAMLPARFTKWHCVQNYTAAINLQPSSTLDFECMQACQILHVIDEINLRHINKEGKKKKPKYRF